MMGISGIIIIKQYLIFSLFFVSFVKSIRNNNTFFPRLPVGDFQINMKRISLCDSTDRKIQVNWYLRKMSPSKADINGNMTLNIPLDDTLYFIVHIDERKTNGGWTNDIVTIKKRNGCSDILKFVKKEYYVAFGYPEEMLPATCPFLPRVYYTKGLPANNWEKILNLPKYFFYGTFRFRIIGTTVDNEEITCFQMMCDIQRPWEIS